MTKKIESVSAIFAVTLSVLLVAQLHKHNAQHTARQLNEIELTEQLHSAAVESYFQSGQHSLPVTVADAQKAEEDARRAEEAAKQRRYEYAQKCFKDWNCYKLAEASYFEDRGGGVEGMTAVANVVINRVDSRRFPSTIAGVVNQKRKTAYGWVCQFSYVCQLKDLKMKDKKSRVLAGYVAWKVFEGTLEDITNGADHYYNPAKVKKTPKFAQVYTQVASISDHLFYRSM